MTTDEVRRRIAGGETFHVEFKGERRGALNDHDLVEAVVCLANGEGGFLLIGVEDDGTVTGARPRHEAGVTDPRRVEALVGNRTNPPVGARCEVVEIGGKQIVLIHVPEAPSPVGTSDGRFLRRVTSGDGKPACLPMQFHEMQARQASRGAFDYSAQPVASAAWRDLDPLEIERFRRMVRASGGRGDAALVSLPDIEVAKSLGVVEANHAVRTVLVAGLLLFGRDAALARLLPTHEVAFQVLRGTAVASNEFLRWPLLRTFENLMERFAAWNEEQELRVGALRIAVPTFSPAAFREALGNALVHRDYQQLGAVHVQLRPDRLEIGSPGGFPLGVRSDNLLVVQPRLRNPLLAGALKRVGLVERTGRGIDTIFVEQLRYGRPVPDYSRSNRETVSVELRAEPIRAGMVRLVAEQEAAGRPFDLDDLLVLNRAARSESLTIADVGRLIQRSESAAAEVLARLAERGFLARTGTETNPFRLSSSAASLLSVETRYADVRRPPVISE